MTLPVGGKELDPLLARDVGARLHEAMTGAMREVRALEASVGAGAADLALKGNCSPPVGLSQGA
jgi:hypothetical protein